MRLAPLFLFATLACTTTPTAPPEASRAEAPAEPASLVQAARHCSDDGRVCLRTRNDRPREVRVHVRGTNIQGGGLSWQYVGGNRTAPLGTVLHHTLAHNGLKFRFVCAGHPKSYTWAKSRHGGWYRQSPINPGWHGDVDFRVNWHTDAGLRFSREITFNCS